MQDSRFAMEQMLRDLDMAIGKEILKLLPTKLGTLPVVDKQDDVSGTGSLCRIVCATVIMAAIQSKDPLRSSTTRHLSIH
ncbi:MAG: hypothetical protein U5K54_14595 [Cytophagales bacterium]|nr:hypothetical protein [Cytophagales bacterium]